MLAFKIFSVMLEKPITVDGCNIFLDVDHEDMKIEILTYEFQSLLPLLWINN